MPERRGQLLAVRVVGDRQSRADRRRHREHLGPAEVVAGRGAGVGDADRLPRVVVMAARPGRVIADLPIAAPYPRDEAFRTSPVYNALCRNVSGELRRAMGEAA